MTLSPLISSSRVSVLCLFGFLLPACDAQLAPEKDAATQGTPTPVLEAAKTGSDLPVAKPEDRITVHYHRQDGIYDDANLFTWDERKKNTPKDSVLKPRGRDGFGAVFQLDRAKYGGSDKIGFITRLGMDWKRKDGGDKIWNPALGNEVWVVSRRNDVLAQPPDISPRVEAAYGDAPDKIIVQLTAAAPTPAKAVLLTEAGVEKLTSSKPGASSLELEVTPQESLDVANHRYRVKMEGFGDAMPLTPRGLLDQGDSCYDADAVLGAAYAPQSTAFRVFAPTAQSVSLVLYDEATGNDGRSVTALQSRAKGIWELTLPGNLSGKFYTYLLDAPGLPSAREVLDPYAVNAVASGARGRITDLSAPVVRPGPAVASPVDMVIYEMHVRDFTISPSSGVRNRGLYPGFTEPDTTLPGDAKIRTALDSLTELGVTHVQLLPVHDFPNNGDEAKRPYNWGYLTSAFFSPEGMYATEPNNDSRVRELKALVDALHARGIGVILDVVYNHTAEDASFLTLGPDHYYRHLPDGSLENGSACGNDFRSEAPMARKLILDSLKFWVREYGVDGFRFDLMALIDQETMRQAERELRAINPHIVLYGEPWMSGSSLLRDKTDKEALYKVQPTGAFNDDFRNALKGLPDGNEPGWIQNGSKREALKTAMLVSNWFASPAQSINYLTCHDNLVLWDKLKSSMPGASERRLIETMKLGYLALFTSQGVPFLHGGEEFARSKGGNHNSYDAPDSVNQVDWSLKQRHYDLFTYVRDLIALRKAHPVFRLRSRQQVESRLKFQDTLNDKALMFTLSGSDVPGETWQRVCVILNSDDSAADLTLPDGGWSVAFDWAGAVTTGSQSGKISVPEKSGLVLYQR